MICCPNVSIFSFWQSLGCRVDLSSIKPVPQTPEKPSSTIVEKVSTPSEEPVKVCHAFVLNFKSLLMLVHVQAHGSKLLSRHEVSRCRTRDESEESTAHMSSKKCKKYHCSVLYIISQICWFFSTYDLFCKLMYSLQEVAESRVSDIEQDTEEKEASKEPVVEKLPENMETNTYSVAMEANDTSALDNVTMDTSTFDSSAVDMSVASETDTNTSTRSH